MTSISYFDFFEIEESFFLNESHLKKKYLENSRKYHPDFFTLEDDEAQDKALEMSTLNNNAYNTLNSFDKRVKYILDTNNIMEEEGQNNVPNEFLMEMMDVNEALMELEFDTDANTLSSTIDSIKKLSISIYSEVEPDMMKYVKGSDEAKEILTKVKEYYLKNKYLLRIKEKIDTFADR